MFRIIIIFLLLYLAFRVVFRYVIPFFASLVAREMKDQMGQEKKQSTPMNKKEDDDQGHYIDYEEVKDQ